MKFSRFFHQSNDLDVENRAPKGSAKKLDSIKALALFFAAITIFNIFDIYTDIAEKKGYWHLLDEALIAIGAAGSFLYLVSKIKRQAASLATQKGELDRATQEVLNWREEAAILRSGISAQIEKEFTKWHLTEAESEVAHLLLKGFSLTKIGELRGVVEKTVRSQTHSIYSKSGLAGRAEFSAYFIEDLF